MRFLETVSLILSGRVIRWLYPAVSITTIALGGVASASATESDRTLLVSAIFSVSSYEEADLRLVNMCDETRNLIVRIKRLGPGMPDQGAESLTQVELHSLAGGNVTLSPGSLSYAGGRTYYLVEIEQEAATPAGVPVPYPCGAFGQTNRILAVAAIRDTLSGRLHTMIDLNPPSRFNGNGETTPTAELIVKKAISTVAYVSSADRAEVALYNGCAAPIAWSFDVKVEGQTVTREGNLEPGEYVVREVVASEPHHDRWIEIFSYSHSITPGAAACPPQAVTASTILVSTETDETAAALLLPAVQAARKAAR